MWLHIKRVISIWANWTVNRRLEFKYNGVFILYFAVYLKCLNERYHSKQTKSNFMSSFIYKTTHATNFVTLNIQIDSKTVFTVEMQICNWSTCASYYRILFDVCSGRNDMQTTSLFTNLTFVRFVNWLCVLD